MRHDGTSWAYVGPPGFWPAGYPTVAIDNAGTPHVVFQDFNNWYRAVVLAFRQGSWTSVGPSSFTKDRVWYPSLAFDPRDNTPYLAFGDENHDIKASCMKFDGSAWQYVGNPGFSEWKAFYTRCALQLLAALGMCWTKSSKTWEASGHLCLRLPGGGSLSPFPL